MDRDTLIRIGRLLDDARPRANAMDGWILAIVVF
jgi:hypothetical protein